MSGDYDRRLQQLIADHQRMQDEYAQMVDAGPKEPDFDNPQLPWAQWYERFNEVKERMYRLAYDLDIPYKQGEVDADEYARVWAEVQSRLTATAIDGNRRVGGLW